MYATFSVESGAWRRASPAHASSVASVANGNPVSVQALRTLPDSILVGWGVRRLDNPSIPSGLPHQEMVESGIVINGDRATQTYAWQDLSLDLAKERAKAQIDLTADQLRIADITIAIDGTNYEFPMDPAATHKYTMLAGALSSGVEYPADGIPFVVKVEGVKQRLRLNATQWQTVVTAMSTRIFEISNRESALENDIDNAEDLSALRAIDLQGGWTP